MGQHDAVPLVDGTLFTALVDVMVGSTVEHARVD